MENNYLLEKLNREKQAQMLAEAEQMRLVKQLKQAARDATIDTKKTAETRVRSGWWPFSKSTHTAPRTIQIAKQGGKRSAS